MEILTPLTFAQNGSVQRLIRLQTNHTFRGQIVESPLSTTACRKRALKHVGKIRTFRPPLAHFSTAVSKSRYDHRLHGVLLVCSGLNCYEVADLLGQCPRTIQYWVNRFERDGFAGLQEGERSGRPSALDELTRQEMGNDLRCEPQAWGYTQVLWDGKLLSHHLSRQYGIQVGVRQCQRLFKQLGLRRRKPRPVIAQADPEAQAAYKKTPSMGKAK